MFQNEGHVPLQNSGNEKPHLKIGKIREMPCLINEKFYSFLLSDCSISAVARRKKDEVTFCD